MLRRPPLPLVGLAFFLSGAAALVYQVAWQRILALHTGVGIRSIAVIVAAFMIGLGAGSQLGGLASARVTPRRALVLFAACELAVAAFGAVSCHLFYDWLYLRFGRLYASPVRAGMLHLAGLALPTLLMGMSLPFLVRAMVRSVARASDTIAFLYGVNVLGAATGALLTPWLLVRYHGIRAAVLVAVAANLVAGLGTLALGAGARPRPADGTAEPSRASPVGEPVRPFASWLALYGLSGFCALALEILWFRILDVAVKSAAYTLGTLLAVYLMGSALGTFAGIPVARRSRAPLRAFLTCQCLLLVYAGLGVALLARLPPRAPGYSWYFTFWGSDLTFDPDVLPPSALLRLYVVLPLLLFGPPTVLMGLSYPFLQRAVQDDPATSGRKVGLLQAVNIGGCVAGSLLVGVVALDLVGTSGTLCVLLAVGLVFAGIGFFDGGVGARPLFAALAVLLVVAVAVTPSQRALWLRLHGTTAAATLVDEDASGVVALVPSTPGSWHVCAGGRSHSWLPFGGIHTALGGVPSIIHPAPRHVAIIGLGSGDTAAAAGCRRDVDQDITIFELYAPEHRLLRELLEVDPPPKLKRLLDDPRYRFRIADGRNAVEHGDQSYDLIEADALWPTSPYAGNVYSLEFFRMCALRLRPGGLLTTWAPTPRVRATFLAAFPHAVEFPGRVLVGSDAPLPIDPEEWGQRLLVAATRAWLGEDRAETVLKFLRGARAVASQGSPAPAALNLDLFPRDEFSTPMGRAPP